MKRNEMKYVVDLLNKYRDYYYNKNESLVSDLEYDNLYDELQKLEEETGIVLSNSPTVSVGYEVKSSLEKVKHNHPMLSLDKTKDISCIVNFLGKKDTIVMSKMDGLTCSLMYLEGNLVSAETRGDGIIGENITHNIKVVKNVPLQIPVKGRVIVDGEIIINKLNFENLKETVNSENEKTYKNSRNLASGSIRLLDSRECKKRKLEFVAWKVIEGIDLKYQTNNLYYLSNIGFTVVPFIQILEPNKDNCKDAVKRLQIISNELNYPIDGCVFGFNNIEYGNSLGATSHHVRSQIAYKFYDDLFETTIRNIDWTIGKTGVLTPTAIFDTVEIDGTDVNRASLHNISIMKQLNVRKNCTARVFKANMIIPQIDSTDDDGTEDFTIPKVCPICGSKTVITKDNNSEILRCVNVDCKGVLLGKICNYVSKQAMNIEGLGEKSISRFMSLDLINRIEDIYLLHQHESEIESLDGFGESSVNKLLESIENSLNTTLDRFIYALSFDNVGYTTAKKIAEQFHYDIDEFTCAMDNSFNFASMDGLGNKFDDSIHAWWNVNKNEVLRLIKYLNFEKVEIEEKINNNAKINGKTFCITGIFEKSRKEIEQKLESMGGKSVSSVNKKTDILFVGSKPGSKLSKANELGIEIVFEENLKDWIS